MSTVYDTGHDYYTIPHSGAGCKKTGRLASTNAPTDGHLSVAARVSDHANGANSYGRIKKNPKETQHFYANPSQFRKIVVDTCYDAG